MLGRRHIVFAFVGGYLFVVVVLVGSKLSTPRMAQDLTKVSEAEQIAFFNSFDNVFSDIDGVLWFLTQQIPYSCEAIKAFKDLGKNVRYVSNNNIKPYEEYVSKLRSAGFEDDLVTPTVAILEHLQDIQFSKSIYLVGMSATKNHIQNAGFSIVECESDRIADTHIKDLRNQITDDENIGAVVAEFDLNVNYVKLQKAITYLERPDVLFLAGGMDARIPIGERQAIIGPKYSIATIEEFSGRKPQVFAKPSPLLNQYLSSKYNIPDPSRVLFIGDSIADDMAFGTVSGYKKLLVLSGLAKIEDVKNWQYPESWKPDYYVDSLKDVFDVLSNLAGKL